MTPTTIKYHPTKFIKLGFDDADAALLPDPEKVNVSEWIREAIREKAKREAVAKAAAIAKGKE